MFSHCFYKPVDWGGENNLFFKREGTGDTTLSFNQTTECLCLPNKLSITVFALALYGELMELEVDLKQILRNHHTRPPSFFFFPNGKFTDSGGKVRLLQTGMESCLNVGWYCAFSEMQAKILAINKTAYNKTQAWVLSSWSHAVTSLSLFLIEVEF